MAHRASTGSGRARRGRGRRGKSVAAASGQARNPAGATHRQPRQGGASAISARSERALAVGSGQHAPALGAGGRVGHGLGPEPLLTISTGGATPLLSLVGAQHASLGDTLHAWDSWSAARDQAANRLWRRPGGLTRMAGL